jgi:hypothetical protein
MARSGAKKSSSRPGGVGSGRGIRGGGTADKRGKTREEQKHGEAGKKLGKAGHNTSKTPKWAGLPKKDTGTLRPGHHGVIKGYKTP